MLYMPHQIRTSTKVYSFVLAALLALLYGCASTPDYEFEPPAFPPPPDEAKYIWERSIRSSADIAETTFADKFQYAITSAGRQGIGLSKPYGIAVHQGRIYITDTVARNVVMLDIPNKDYRIIGTEGIGALVKPIGIDISKDGEVYVADNTAKRVIVYDKDGNYLRSIGGQQYLERPSGVAVSPDGNTVYVIDTGGVDSQEAHRLQIFDAKSGKLIKSVGKRGTKEGEFNLALQVATGPEGNVYVVDGGNFRVQVFDAKGEFLHTFGNAGVKSGQFSRPKGIATNKEGHVFVIDTGFANLQIFDSTGQLLTFIGTRGYDGPAKYVLPAGVAVDEDGRIYIIDQYFRKIDIFRPATLKTNEGYLGSLKENKRPL